MKKNLKTKKPLFEEFAKFLETPSRDKLRDVLKNNVGEFPFCDFKENWPELPKLAKIVLGIANFGNGCIIVGVAESNEDKTLDPKGVEKFVDKVDITKKVFEYIPEKLYKNIEILDFNYSATEYGKIAGKKFQVMFIESDAKYLPYISMRSGTGIERDRIYARRGTSTEQANYEELQSIINRRLDTGYSTAAEIDLETHFKQLKVLYHQINPYISILEEYDFDDEYLKDEQGLIPNPNHPQEDYEIFIAKLIERKKKRIEILLDINGY
jgi:hypothetical protein